MDIKEKIKTVDLEKVAVTQKYQDLKTEFKNYITDKSIPVIDRWEFFEQAQSELKENLDYIWSPSSKFLQARLDRFNDMPEIYGRGKKIEVTDFFEDIVWGGKIWMENLADKTLKEDDIKNALEEILEQNLEYFLFDW